MRVDDVNRCVPVSERHIPALLVLALKGCLVGKYLLLDLASVFRRRLVLVRDDDPIVVPDVFSGAMAGSRVDGVIDDVDRIQAPAQGQPKDKAEQNAAGRDSGSTVSPPVPPQDPAYAAGEKLFLAKGCVGCHSLQAANAPKGMIGPNLANVGARSYIGAGSFKNTDENLARWIQNPQAMKTGVLMPNLGVKPDEAKSLVAFLRAHQ